MNNNINTRRYTAEAINFSSSATTHTSPQTPVRCFDTGDVSGDKSDKHQHDDQRLVEHGERKDQLRGMDRQQPSRE